MVLGLRRPVRARAARLRLPADRVEPAAQLLRRPQHRHADDVRGAGQLRRHALATPAFRSSLRHLRGVRRVHRARPRSRCRSGWRCWSTAPASRGPSSGRCSSCRPRAPTSWRRWSGRCRSSSGVRFGLANTVLGWFGIEPVAWLSVSHPPWYWLVIVSARLWLQVGFYMILFLAGLQRIPPDALRGGRDRRRRRAGRCFGTSPCRSCGRRRRRCCCCCSSTPSRRSTSSTTCSRARHLPAVRAAAAGLPLLHGARPGPGLRPRQRRRGDPDPAHRVITLGQGRFLGSAAGGLTDGRSIRRDPRRPRRATAGPATSPWWSARPVPGPLLPDLRNGLSRGRHHRAGLAAASRRRCSGATSPSCSTTPPCRWRAACVNSVARRGAQTVGRAGPVRPRRLRPGPHPVPPRQHGLLR